MRALTEEVNGIIMYLYPEGLNFWINLSRTLKYFNGWLLQNGCNVSELWDKIYVSVYEFCHILCMHACMYINGSSFSHILGCYYKDIAYSSAISRAFLHCLSTRHQDWWKVSMLRSARFRHSTGWEQETLATGGMWYNYTKHCDGLLDYELSNCLGESITKFWHRCSNRFGHKNWGNIRRNKIGWNSVSQNKFKYHCTVTIHCAILFLPILSVSFQASW